MATGLIIYGDNGKVQITEEYPVYQYAGGGTFSTADSMTQLLHQNDFTFTTDIVALRCLTPGSYFTPFIRNRSGSNFPLPAGYSGMIEIWDVSVDPSVFEYRIYRPPNNVGLPSAGLKVWNSAGQIVFRSDRQAFSAIAAPHGRFPRGTRDLTIPTPWAERPAIVPGRLPFWEELGMLNLARVRLRPGAVDIQTYDFPSDDGPDDPEFGGGRIYHFLVTQF